MKESFCDLWFPKHADWSIPMAVVPKIWLNYPTVVICDSPWDNAELKSQWWSVVYALTAK